VVAPPTGWLRAVTVSLGMSLQQLADRLSITKQSAQEIELHEKEGLLIETIVLFILNSDFSVLGKLSISSLGRRCAIK